MSDKSQNTNKKWNKIQLLDSLNNKVVAPMLSEAKELKAVVLELSYFLSEKKKEIYDTIKPEEVIEPAISVVEVSLQENDEELEDNSNDTNTEEFSTDTSDNNIIKELTDKEEEVAPEPKQEIKETVVEIIEEIKPKKEKKVSEVSSTTSKSVSKDKKSEKTSTAPEKSEQVKVKVPPKASAVKSTPPKPFAGFKSRAKTTEEKNLANSRIYIPDNTTKSSGQPKPNNFIRTQGDTRKTASPNSTYKPTIKPVVDAVSAVPLKKESVRNFKKKDSKVADNIKRPMDKRTLVRRGFVDNFTPGASYEGDFASRRYKPRKKKMDTSSTQDITNAVLTSDIVPIKVLSEKIGKTGAQLIKKLFELGIMKNINDTIDFETAELIATEWGVDLTLNAAKSNEELLEDQFEDDTDIETLKPRPPVVAVLGHVDHGKTSVLDYIRQENVTEGEAGGITQHIGAYTVLTDNGIVTFLDTPGHEAFTSMRLRGAQATDIAIIVVAADDGVMPQTIEAIAHAKASGVAIIVAINKMDKRQANPDRIKQQLSDHDLLPEEWGGQTICVPVSAKTGEGIDKLLETIHLVAEMLELNANYDNYARGVIIEARLDKGRGPVATILVQSGTLRVGDSLVSGTVIGKVRAMIDAKGAMVKEALPSTPVQVQGWDKVPQAGDLMFAVANERLAKRVISDRLDQEKYDSTTNRSGSSLEDLLLRMKEGELINLNLIIKGDVQGSVEAIKQQLSKLTNEEVKVNIVQANVGAITESDVMLAETANAIIIGFNVRPDNKSKKMAENNNIDIRTYRVIYDIINDIELAMKGMLSPEFAETVLGRAEARVIYKITGVGVIAGSYVIDGKIIRKARARLLRNGTIIFEGDISSLKREKDDAKEVAQGYECGIGIDGYNDIKEGDVIEAYIVEEIERL